MSFFLTGLFQVSDPGESRGNSITAREIFDRGAERVRTELQDQPIVQAQITRAVAMRTDRAAPDDADFARRLRNLGSAFLAQSRFADAEPVFLRTPDSALGILALRVQPNHLSNATAEYDLANVLRDAGRYAQAEPRYLRALAIRETAFGVSSPAVVEVLRDYAKLLQSLGRNHQAARLQLRADAVRG